MIKHTKEFGVYHWDTFDNETFLQHESDSYDECVGWIADHYKDRIGNNGADRVEIVDKKGNVVRYFNVG